MASGGLRGVLTKVLLLPAFEKEDEPAGAAVLKHIRVVGTLAVERDQDLLTRE
jgi:hypothetical protein